MRRPIVSGSGVDGSSVGGWGLVDDEDNPWTVQSYVDYWRQPHKSNILNIISLEVSESKLRPLVEPPALVMQLDWAERYWPRRHASAQDLHPPFPQRYLLMSVQDSFTDFHIDMGGSAVWYNPVRGVKVFLCLEPTEKHLAAYQRYTKDPRRKDVWRGCVGHLVTVREGEVVLLPSGWIHAVHTPCDSVVFGGNFLCTISLDMSLRVYLLERLTSTSPVVWLMVCDGRDGLVSECGCMAPVAERLGCV